MEPCPETLQFSSYWIHFNIVLPITSPFLKQRLIRLSSSTKFCINSLFLLFVLHVPSISFLLICLPLQWHLKCSKYENFIM
jgi:hypothetical protein